MGRKPSIDEDTGEALIAAYQRLGNVAAAAREVGVSESAARRYLDATPEAAAPVIAQQRAILETANSSLWDTRASLDENYGRLLKLYRQLDAGIVQQNGEFVTVTPVATNVAALREIREHIRLSVDLAKLLIDIEEVRKFQQAVIEAIGEADPPTRDRLIAKLRERRAVGLALGGPGGAAGQP